MKKSMITLTAAALVLSGSLAAVAAPANKAPGEARLRVTVEVPKAAPHAQFIVKLGASEYTITSNKSFAVLNWINNDIAAGKAGHMSSCTQNDGPYKIKDLESGDVKIVLLDSGKCYYTVENAVLKTMK